MNILEITRTHAVKAGMTESARFPSAVYTGAQWDRVCDALGRGNCPGRITVDRATSEAVVFFAPEDSAKVAALIAAQTAAFSA